MRSFRRLTATPFRNSPRVNTLRNNPAASTAERKATTPLGEGCYFHGEDILLDVLRIEMASDPFAELDVAAVLGIVDRLKEFGVARGAADVFRGTASAGPDHARVEHVRDWLDEPLELDVPRGKTAGLRATAIIDLAKAGMWRPTRMNSGFKNPASIKSVVRVLLDQNLMCP